MLKKYTILFLLLFIILPIFEAYYYNGYASYREYYNNHINGVYSMSSKIAEQPNDKKKDRQKVVEYSEENNGGPLNQADFIFPDDNKLRTQNGDRNDLESRIGKIMSRCDGQLFCENVQNYPKEFVNQMLQKNSDLYVYAFEDAVPIDSRIEDLEDVKELCPSIEYDIIPEAAESGNGEWMLIVQSKEMNFQQRIHIEKCQEQDSTCQIINDNLPEGYFSRCQQKYIYRKLLAITDNLETVHDSFPFPASCCCHLYFHPN